MGTLLYMIAGGLLARADGWGGEEWASNTPLVWLAKKLGKDPQKFILSIIDFFNAWTCAGLFALATLLYTSNLLMSLLAGLAFALWRIPGFDGWQKWWGMAWRGFWPTAIGFTLLSYAGHEHFYFGFLAILMGAAEALAYAGSYKWLPGRIPQWAVHVTAEISSGLAFTGLGAVILKGARQWMST